MKIKTIYVEFMGILATIMMLWLLIGAYPDGRVMIEFNSYGEYIIEFIFCILTLISMIIISVIDWTKYFKSP